MKSQSTAHLVYSKLIGFYPAGFRARVGESMEQTFSDLYRERKQGDPERLFGFLLRTYLDTSIGIFQEHLLLIFHGGPVKNMLINLRAPFLLSVLITLPLLVMEVVNRREYNEDFPVVLFVVIWLNLLSVGLILLPILRAWRASKSATPDPVPAPRNSALTNPRSAALISIALILAPGILPLLDSIGWLSVDGLFNGPNPEVAYLQGTVLSLGFFAIPIAAGIIAAGPVANTLRAGGRLLAHPINLIIVGILVASLVLGLSGLLMDQWPCFMGVRNCD